MSKKMTPCEKLGYNVGDEFTVIEDSFKFGVGSIVSLQEDDGTSSPYFTNECVKDEYPYGVSCFLSSVKKFSKLKPAKQALADAIHQNGGWVDGDYRFATSNSYGDVFCSMESPSRAGYLWVNGFSYKLVCSLSGTLQNWHQTILSRDEYFTAYPEPVKIEVNNETERKVDVEMTSESEMTIKVSDWHKNGELPHVGEVCEAFVYEDDSWSEVEIIAHKDGIAIGWSSIDELTYQSRNEKSFRPLRTERDKAIDDMVYCLSARWANCEEIAAHLYENGYRKEVK